MSGIVVWCELVRFEKFSLQDDHFCNFLGPKKSEKSVLMYVIKVYRLRPLMVPNN